MLEVLSTDITVNSGDSIPLENVVIAAGDDVVIKDVASLLLIGCGVYKIEVSANATSLSSEVGTVGVQIARDGVLEGIPSEASVTDILSVHPLSVSHLIKAPAVVTIQNVGNSATFDVDIMARLVG